jgi:SAM-dependent methyltransferase
MQHDPDTIESAPMKPPPNFNVIARPYRYLEYITLGRALERCRTHFLPNLLGCKQALLLGDGDGRFLAQLLSQNSHLHTDAVDSSFSMLQLLRRNAEAAASNAFHRLRTHHTNALTFLPAKTYDLVVTHFFLDCLTQPELELLIARLTPALTPKALWLVSDFRIPAGPLRLPASLFIRSLYLAFRLLTGLRTARLPDHATPLLHAGFIRLSHHTSLAGLLITELWQASNQTTQHQ